MTFVLNSRVSLHPFGPRESRATIHTRTAGNPDTHVLLVKGGRGDLAINGTEVTRLLFVQIVTRSNDL